MNRRGFLQLSAPSVLSPLAVGASLTAALGLSMPNIAKAADYRALVVVFLKGGYDGNDMLVPLDGGYTDYAKARSDLALARDVLLPIRGYAGGNLGMHPALAPLKPAYEQGRMLWISNIGALVRPTSAAQWRTHEVAVPPFLMSHSEQVNIVQGWDPANILNGWGGRGMELLSSDLTRSLPVVSYAFDNTLVTGLRSRMTIANSNGSRFWGRADLTQRSNRWTQLVESLGHFQSRNPVENEFARTLEASFSDSAALSIAENKTSPNKATFPDNRLGRDLAHIARLMPVFKADGVRRQLFFTDFGQFDTHVTQRGDAEGRAMDVQVAQVADALAAFDAELRSRNLDGEVLTLVMTEFGRTLQPTGQGTDHAWGNHWFLLGSRVKGAQVMGRIPELVLGGKDDGDPWKKGRWAPDYSSDQLAASVMRWIGLGDDRLVQVFPNLSNFKDKTLAILS
ncbi:MAG: DUF1501 domain-containing protein [Proteobacteria bacterium]|nr:DUF1501 domain-containing protein [Pseudomonadota bacterium]